MAGFSPSWRNYGGILSLMAELWRDSLYDLSIIPPYPL
jgi:hypothetical protein